MLPWILLLVLGDTVCNLTPVSVWLEKLVLGVFRVKKV
jgi:hypothetical protein